MHAAVPNDVSCVLACRQMVAYARAMWHMHGTHVAHIISVKLLSV